MTIDETLAAAWRDSQTVTPDGKSTAREIDGVKVRSTVNHVDHRGSVFEIFEGDPTFWASPVVYAYQFSCLPGQVKGWGLHEKKFDRYTIISGEILTLLYDARPDSPTQGVVQKVTMSDRASRQLIIPPFVWHLNINIGDSEARLINFPTEVYNHAAPDRLLLPWDTDQIPANAKDYFPKF